MTKKSTNNNYISCLIFMSICSGKSFAEIDKSQSQLEHIEVIAEPGSNIRNSTTKTTDDISEFLTLSLDRIEDIAAYLPGVLAGTGNAGMETALTIRGFSTGRSNILLNGHLDNQRMFIRATETVEHVAIEKGHSSILYGGAAPGGTLIYQTKKPTLLPYNSITTTFGSHEKYKLTLDSSGKISEKLEYRTVLMKQEAGSFIDNVRDDRETVYSHLSWSISEQQKIGFEFEYNELTNPWTFGIVRVDDTILYDKSYVYPATVSDRDYRRSSIYYDYLYADDLKFSIKLNHVDVDRDDVWMGFFYKLANDKLVGYSADIDNTATQNNARFTVEKLLTTAWSDHNIHLGFDYNKYKNTQHMDRSIGTFIIDPYKPDFNIMKPTEINSVRKFGFEESDKSVFLLDNIEFNDSLLVSVGVRKSKFKIVDNITNTVSVDKSTITSFIGAAYQLNEKTKLYSNISTSFEPNTGVDKNNQYFKPQKATQNEVALEYIINEHHNITVAVYQIEQKNLLTRDPTDPDFKILAGTIESKGVELSLDNYFNEMWKITTSFTHIKHSFNNKLSNNNRNEGSSIPTNSFSSILHWGAQSNLGAHIGIISLSERYGDNANSFKLPGYARIDLGAHKDFGDWKIRLDVENLLNKKYIVTSNYDDDMYPGRTRDIRISLSYSW